MKKINLFIIILVLTSCNFFEKKDEISYPLKEVEVRSIILEESNEVISDTLTLSKFSNYLRDLSNNDLVKGKRLHGASKMCSLTIKTDKYDLSLFVLNNRQNKIVVDFFEVNEKDNFNYFLGALYENQKLINLLNSGGLNCIEEK
ncbi:hypothetical protein LB452_13295 [Psychroflexus sp. CAK8W]|uniref:DUF4252 domain-containing protein n=1 Tax=Psychroflexus longus TaxID=2873596 RepID=A0ABS7XN72_9FLAO|nr:hypothetical protein [Psychroflexus longus]MBZ9779898.1 hypothetical protein [Psychroflexus longus]